MCFTLPPFDGKLNVMSKREQGVHGCEPSVHHKAAHLIGSWLFSTSTSTKSFGDRQDKEPRSAELESCNPVRPKVRAFESKNAPAHAAKQNGAD